MLNLPNAFFRSSVYMLSMFSKRYLTHNEMHTAKSTIHMNGVRAVAVLDVSEIKKYIKKQHEIQTMVWI